MTSLATLRRRRAAAIVALDKAIKSKAGTIGAARRGFARATAELLRAELNHRRAAPLLRTKAQGEQTGDLFAQMGA
jgi:hypothetical protein